MGAGPGYVKFVAYDLAQAYVDGVSVAETWRSGSLSGIPITALSSFCSHPTGVPASEAASFTGRGAAVIELTLLVTSYGRENFYTVGHSSQVCDQDWISSNTQQTCLLYT